MIYFGIRCFLINCWIIFLMNADAARILAIHPIRARSHFSFHEGIINCLLEAGHHITLIGPFAPKYPHENITHINSRTETSENMSKFSKFDFQMKPWWEIINMFTKIYEKDCYSVMKLKEIHEIMTARDRMYDVLFVELLTMYECYIPIADKLGIPIIGTLSLRYMQIPDNIFGNDKNPAAIPFEFSSTPLRKMTFYHRLQNVLYYIISDLQYWFFERPMIKKFYEIHFTDYNSKTNKEISLLFTNNHPSIFPRAVVPNTIEIGGIHLNQRTNFLDEEFKKFIDEAEHGVILLSFGSIIKSNVIDSKTKNIFKTVFAKIPQRVIWKLDENIEDLSDNVLLSPWIPQEHILVRPNVKVFISHCGIHGTYEAIHGGKPMVLVPFFADQYSNAALLHELNVGVYLDIHSLTEENLLNAINTIVNESSYRENMEKFSRAFKDRPMSPQRTVAFWTEYVIRYNGTKHLRSAVADIPLYQYLLLDVIFFATAVFTLLLFTLLHISKKFYVFVCSRASVRKPASHDTKKNR